MGITEARQQFSELIDTLDERDVILLRRSRPAAVLLSHARYEELLDRLEQLEDEVSVLDAKANPGDRVSLDEVRRRHNALA